MQSRIVRVLLALVVCAVAGAGLLPATGVVASAAAQVPALPAHEPGGNETRSRQPNQFADLVTSAEAAGVSKPVLALALGAVTCAVQTGDIAPPPTLTLIDYSRPSTEPRLWVFDLRTGELRFHELVAHGKGTGDNLAEHFSDDPNSHQSSLGLFVTGAPYVGSNGYSLHLDGLEPGFNSRARERAIVMHGAPYVDASFAVRQGRLGRSWGCPALRQAVAHQVIDLVGHGGVVFSYYPDQRWLERSKFLHCSASQQPDSTLANAE